VADAAGEDSGPAHPARPARRKRRRLSRSGEFERVYREGRSHAGRHLILYAFPRTSGDEGPRLGISVGRRVGGAVERNRVKRALRESFWACAEPLPDTHDFVIVARPEAAKLTADEGEPGLREALRVLMDEAGLTGARPE
jgi:ribonuclease P protein component